MLAELAQANVPLGALDSSHEWYRLHGLFREMLQTELRRSEPELAPLVASAGGDWYLPTPGTSTARIDHASHGRDLDRLRELLWTHLPGYLGEGRNDLRFSAG